MWRCLGSGGGGQQVDSWVSAHAVRGGLARAQRGRGKARGGGGGLRDDPTTTATAATTHLFLPSLGSSKSEGVGKYDM